MKKLLFACLVAAISLQCYGSTVTGFTGTYRNGQVFFTWNNTTANGATYKLYRSSTQITKGSQLSSSEYLGLTNQSSAVNNHLTAHDGTNKYYIIQTGGAPLLSTQGLFVTTSLANASYYYALTVVTNNVEDTAIHVGSSSLTSPIAETVSTPQPVLQETRLIDNMPVEIYVDYMSSKITLNGPLRLKAGWLGYDFAVYKNNATTPQALHMRFHAGGNDFLNNITNVSGSEINLGLEDDFPDAENSGWLGTNQQYDPYKKSNNSAWTSGTNYFYSIDRINKELNWVIANFPADSNQVYVDGVSFGAVGAFFFTLLHPEKIAAANLTSGIFNFGFLNDFNPLCTMNTGQKNRSGGDKKFGSVSNNLLEGSGSHTYDLLNGGSMIHQYNLSDYPVIFSVNGRSDSLLGWTEKTIWYDSVNNNKLGGYYFYDRRDHAGNKKAWASGNFDMYRYRKNLSYPAFSDCSVNENPGNGNGADGDSVGTVNGFLDWNSNITDDASNWVVEIYTRSLEKINSVILPAPSSCTATISARRLQQFKPLTGAVLQWNVKHLSQVIQSGSFTYNGGLITIPNIQIYSDTVILQITTDGTVLTTYYQDSDGDGYGNASVSIQATSQPNGYVTDYTDCNDANGSVHATPVPTISPSGNINACKSAPVVLTANSGIGYTYQWYANDVPLSGAFNTTYTSSVTGTTSYKVLENSGGCTAYSGVTKITRLKVPKATIAVTGNLNICGTGSVLLTESNGVGPAYQWNKNNVAITGATQVTYTATTTGDYTVIVTNSSGCTKKSAKVKVTSSCREEEILSSSSTKIDMSLSPNPASDFVQLQIHSSETIEGTMQIQLVNLLAQTVLSSNIQVNGNDFSQELSLHGIESGMYFVKVIVNDKPIIARLVIGNQ